MPDPKDIDRAREIALSDGDDSKILRALVIDLVATVQCPVCGLDIPDIALNHDDYGAWAPDPADRYQRCPDCDAMFIVEALNV